jgi:hypothetical protein
MAKAGKLFLLSACQNIHLYDDHRRMTGKDAPDHAAPCRSEVERIKTPGLFAPLKLDQPPFFELVDQRCNVPVDFKILQSISR